MSPRKPNNFKRSNPTTQQVEVNDADTRVNIREGLSIHHPELNRVYQRHSENSSRRLNTQIHQKQNYLVQEVDDHNSIVDCNQIAGNYHNHDRRNHHIHNHYFGKYLHKQEIYYNPADSNQKTGNHYDDSKHHKGKYRYFTINTGILPWCEFFGLEPFPRENHAELK